MSLRIIYAGTPEFSVPALQALIDHGHPPIMVLTQPDRPAGRGRALQSSPVKALAEQASIPIEQPTRLKGVSLAHWEADLLVTAAYGLLIPAAILAEPRSGCWNLHASLLPRWRGASPIQQAILAGDAETGISLMQMDEGLDTGPVLLTEATAIGASETAAQLHDRLAKLSAKLLIAGLEALLSDQLPTAIPQAAVGVSHAPLIKKSDALLDWTAPAEHVARAVRAYNPWPVAHTDAFASLGEPMVRIWAAQAGPSVDAPPGHLVPGHRDAIVVACGEGSLEIKELQAPSRRRLTASEWFNAHPNWR